MKDKAYPGNTVQFLNSSFQSFPYPFLIKESASCFLQVRIMKGIYFYRQIFLKFILSQSTINQSETLSLSLTFINYNKRSNNILYFLKARLNDEQSDIVKSIISLTTSETAAKFISAFLPLLATCNFPESETQPFIDSCTRKL